MYTPGVNEKTRLKTRIANRSVQNREVRQGPALRTQDGLKVLRQSKRSESVGTQRNGTYQEEHDAVLVKIRYHFGNFAVRAIHRIHQYQNKHEHVKRHLTRSFSFSDPVFLSHVWISYHCSPGPVCHRRRVCRYACIDWWEEERRISTGVSPMDTHTGKMGRTHSGGQLRPR
jgi:hypothetical protein